MKANKLPSGFRYLLTKRDIRALQEEIGAKFLKIGFGHHLNTERLDDSNSSITIEPISLSGRYVEDGWKFSVYQSGFRDELIPAALEVEAKNGVKEAIKQYMVKAPRFTDNDFIYHPQLWVYCTIYSNKVETKSRELK